jgi:hypothetical protein
MSDYLSKFFPEMAQSYPDTPEKRRAGMAAFRAKFLKTHEAMLAGGDPNTLKKGKVGEAARRYHSDMIASIKAAQKKLGEV